MTHLDTVDTKELGEAIDMIKDLSEAIYYCTITEAMEGKDEYRKEYQGYNYIMPYPEEEYYRDMDKLKGRMYYNGNGSDGRGTSSSNGGAHNGHSSGNSGTRGYSERQVLLEDMMRD
jgi:hypothetical protein